MDDLRRFCSCERSFIWGCRTQTCSWHSWVLNVKFMQKDTHIVSAFVFDWTILTIFFFFFFSLVFPFRARIKSRLLTHITLQLQGCQGRAHISTSTHTHTHTGVDGATSCFLRSLFNTQFTTSGRNSTPEASDDFAWTADLADWGGCSIWPWFVLTLTPPSCPPPSSMLPPPPVNGARLLHAPVPLSLRL